jgi:hypothetical protein
MSIGEAYSDKIYKALITLKLLEDLNKEMHSKGAIKLEEK